MEKLPPPTRAQELAAAGIFVGLHVVGWLALPFIVVAAIAGKVLLPNPEKQ